jgi:hypothetical protein
MHAKSIFVKISEKYFNQYVGNSNILTMVSLRVSGNFKLQSNAFHELTKNYFRLYCVGNRQKPEGL